MRGNRKKSDVIDSNADKGVPKQANVTEVPQKEGRVAFKIEKPSEASKVVEKAPVKKDLEETKTNQTQRPKTARDPISQDM